MKVYLTERNSDTNAGAGPMVDDLCFLNRTYAERYIDAQPGVQGRRAKWSLERFGDWEIKELDVIEYDIIAEQLKMEDIKRLALNKLSDIEKKALGLIK